MATPSEPRRRRRRLYEALPEGAGPEPSAPAAPEPPAPPPDHVVRPTDGPPPGAPAAAAPAPPSADAPSLGPRPAAPDVLVPDRAPSAVGRESEAARIVQRYVYWSAGLSLVPAVGAASVVGVQLKMVRDLARLYGVPFAEHRGRALLATLGGGLGAMTAGTPLLATALAALFPTAWPVLVAASSTASAVTYAIGRVFTQHFQRGGNLHDFRAEETRAALEARLRAAPPAPPPYAPAP